MDADVEWMVRVCADDGTADPMANLRMLTSPSKADMNGPVHHAAVPFALITAVWKSDPFFDLESYLREAYSRATQVPMAACGYWGCCGAAIGAGIFCSVVTRTGPLTRGKRYGNANGMTSAVLARIAEVGGPRCCKRNSAIAVSVASSLSGEYVGTELHCSEYRCGREKDNPECIGTRCPFILRK